MLRTLFFHPKLVGMEKRVEAPGVGDCGRGWGGRRSRSRLRTRTRQISFLSKNAILVPSPQGGEGWQRCAKALRNILNGLHQAGGDKLLPRSLWGPRGLVSPVGRTHIVPVSVGQPAWAEPSEEVAEVAQGHSVWHKVSRWLAVTWPLAHRILGAGPHKSFANRSDHIVPGLLATAACSPKGYLQPEAHCG